MRIIYLILVAMTVLPAGGCSREEKNLPSVTVSILPQKYIVDRLTGGKLPVNVMVPPGHSPATYAPTSRQLRSLAGSPLYLRIGHIAFEKTEMQKLSSINPSMKIIDCSLGVKLIRAGGDSSHGHHHRGSDPHLWLSPRAMKTVARNSAAALSEAFPRDTVKFTKNLEKLIGEIDALDKEISRMLKNKKNRKFLVFHPAWGYFARDYNLSQVAIEREGKEPNSAYLREIINTARHQGITAVIIQKQFPTRWAEAIARDLRGRVIRLDPLSENWPSGIRKTALVFSRELQ